MLFVGKEIEINNLKNVQIVLIGVILLCCSHGLWKPASISRLRAGSSAGTAWMHLSVLILFSGAPNRWDDRGNVTQREMEGWKHGPHANRWDDGASVDQTGEYPTTLARLLPFRK